jgi:hypothetical protein
VRRQPEVFPPGARIPLYRPLNRAQADGTAAADDASTAAVPSTASSTSIIPAVVVAAVVAAVLCVGVAVIVYRVRAARSKTQQATGECDAEGSNHVTADVAA